MAMTIPNNLVGHISTVFSKGKNGERLGFNFNPLKPISGHAGPLLLEIDTQLPEGQRNRLFNLAIAACSTELLAEVTTSSGTATTVDEIEIWNHS